jgi:glycosyltransferase involved in cell wall biosynthesis
MGVAAHVHVVPTGVDDAALKDIFKSQHRRSSEEPVTFAWSGRFSQEKRMMEFLQAFKLAEIPARVQIFGNGPLEKQAQAYIQENGLADRVQIVGRVSHTEMLNRLANADALIQTSVGFETQGMTVYEAGVVGTPSVLCDWNIADDLPEGSYWRVGNQSVASLAQAMRAAYEDILAGNSKKIDLRNSMYQSELYKKSISIYESAIKAHSGS